MNLAIEAVQAILKAEKELNTAKLHLKRINSPLFKRIEKAHNELIEFRKVYLSSMEAIAKGEAYQHESIHFDDKSSHTE